jgi:hypothetical protein
MTKAAKLKSARHPESSVVRIGARTSGAGAVVAGVGAIFSPSPQFVAIDLRAKAMDEIIGGRDAVPALHSRGPGKSGSAGATQQHGHESLADPNAHAERELIVHPPGIIGLPRGRMDLSNPTSETAVASLARAAGACIGNSRDC